MKLAPLDTFSRLRMVSLVRGRYPSRRSGDSGCVRRRRAACPPRSRASFPYDRDRLATSYRLVLDFRPLCDNLLAALDAARSAQYVILSRKIIHETGGFRVRRGESQCPHLGWSIAPVLRATFVIAQHIPMPSF
jgi:hypothetical protein